MLRSQEDLARDYEWVKADLAVWHPGAVDADDQLNGLDEKGSGAIAMRSIESPKPRALASEIRQ
jgi:hypothetical protein